MGVLLGQTLALHVMDVGSLATLAAVRKPYGRNSVHLINITKIYVFRA